MADYNPTPDYNIAYEAALRRLRTGAAGRRSDLNTEINNRGVSTSGVSQIPGEVLGRSEAGAEGDLAGNFALEQANTGIEDRRAEQNFQRQLTLGRQGFDLQSALQRRLAQGQMESALIGGGIGAIGGYFSGMGRGQR